MMVSPDDRGAYSTLEQSLVAPEGDLPTTTAVPMVEVVAPATLSEGYTFEVDVNGSLVEVKVPPGGVEEGQKFTIPLPEQTSLQIGLPRVHVPVGQWKDGLCACCQYGCCHNHIWTSSCCCLIAAGQVISRLKLTWSGWESNNIAETTGAFWILFYIQVAYWTLYFLLGFGIGSIDDPSDITISFLVFAIIRQILSYAHAGLGIFIIYNLRKVVRKKYAIPESESCPTGCEDACCAIWCPMLTVAQMLRHTTDYETYHSSCCTETGVPDTVPSIV